MMLYSVDLCRPHGDHGCYGDLLLEEFGFNDSLPAEYVCLSVSVYRRWNNEIQLLRT